MNNLPHTQARQLNAAAATRLNATGHGRSNRQAGDGQWPAEARICVVRPTA
jgi:hypothetical protein